MLGETLIGIEGTGLPAIDPGTFFQNRIRDFLSSVGFDDVPPSQWEGKKEQFILGGQEIDAFGRDGEFYVVVDAKTRTALRARRRGRNVRTYLSIINGYKNEVVEDIRNRYGELHGYRGTAFVFWTKNVKIERTHQQRARELGIALRDSFDLEYYNQAHRILGNNEIVRSSFLKDILLQLPRLNVFSAGHPIHAKAIRTRFGAKTLYTFPIEVEDLLKFAYVFRIEMNSILGGSYQRLLKERKVRSIRNYLRDENGYFPNNLIAVSEEELTFTPERGERSDASFAFGELHLPDKPCYLEILDGQHRLYGYSNLSDKRTHPLWVTIVEGLSSVDRAKLFLTINKTQTRVEADILWDLYQTTEPRSIRGRISQFVYRLNEAPPFKDLIALPRARSLINYLSFSNFCYSLGPRSHLFSEFGSESNFMNVMKKHFEKIKNDPELIVDWNRSVDNKGRKGFILTNNSISVLLRLLVKVLRRTGLPPNERIESWKNHLDEWVISPIKEYLDDVGSGDEADPYENLRRELTSEGARKDAANAIWEKSPLSDPDYEVSY